MLAFEADWYFGALGSYLPHSIDHKLTPLGNFEKRKPQTRLQLDDMGIQDPMVADDAPSEDMIVKSLEEAHHAGHGVSLKPEGMSFKDFMDLVWLAMEEKRFHSDQTDRKVEKGAEAGEEEKRGG
ncbi:hypothetical protein Tdes44962_MAKER04475 [Teratosphaeria destructans]|uniref:Uncharacterized protein n=1 Tax=Teratosphaeria destructans TaxID=418781 RepID=A0A9W7SM54_9PEZI|nr:hypothetical protein Tdes44962_MAKER04475 [Teratosphaeria destructans]